MFKNLHKRKRGAQMNQQERLIEIMSLLEAKSFLKQEELAKHFDVSKDTARRDILKLVENNLVERHKGGIQLPIIKQQITDYKNRIITNSSEKKSIAKLARTLILDSDTIWLDVSTTVELLSDDSLPKNILAVTNSVDNAVSFSQHIKRILLLGGYYQPDSHQLKGPMLRTQLENYYFDIVFIGASGVSEEGIFFDELEDIYLHQQLAKQGKRIILLLDHSKYQKTTSFKLNWEFVDTIISDELPNQTFKKILLENSIDILTPKGA